MVELGVPKELDSSATSSDSSELAEFTTQDNFDGDLVEVNVEHGNEDDMRTRGTASSERKKTEAQQSAGSRDRTRRGFSLPLFNRPSTSLSQQSAAEAESVRQLDMVQDSLRELRELQIALLDVENHKVRAMLGRQYDEETDELLKEEMTLRATIDQERRVADTAWSLGRLWSSFRSSSRGSGRTSSRGREERSRSPGSISPASLARLQSPPPRPQFLPPPPLRAILKTANASQDGSDERPVRRVRFADMETVSERNDGD